MMDDVFMAIRENKFSTLRPIVSYHPHRQDHALPLVMYQQSSKGYVSRPIVFMSPLRVRFQVAPDKGEAGREAQIECLLVLAMKRMDIA